MSRETDLEVKYGKYGKEIARYKPDIRFRTDQELIEFLEACIEDEESTVLEWTFDRDACQHHVNRAELFRQIAKRLKIKNETLERLQR